MGSLRKQIMAILGRIDSSSLTTAEKKILALVKPKRRGPRRTGKWGKKYTGSWVTFSVYKATEGGQSFTDSAFQLNDAGIEPVERADSPFIGQYGIRVPKKFEKKARRVLGL